MTGVDSFLNNYLALKYIVFLSNKQDCWKIHKELILKIQNNFYQVCNLYKTSMIQPKKSHQTHNKQNNFYLNKSLENIFDSYIRLGDI